MTQVRLVVNTQPFYGSIELVSTHATFKEAVIAGITYRKANPSANGLEIYDHAFGQSSHTLEGMGFDRLLPYI
jgi:hypothetical protein